MTVQVNGQLIKELRIKHSYSQEKLAEIVGVNLRTIQRIESNGVAALSTRGALAKALGVKPEDLDARDAPEAAASSNETAPRPRWWLVTISAVLVVSGVTALATSIDGAVPVGMVTAPAVGGLLIALSGVVLLTRLTPVPRWRIYAVLCIAAVSMIASPPAWTLRALVAVSLWAAFELGILATKLRLRSTLTSIT